MGFKMTSVCVCVCEREREREQLTDKENEIEIGGIKFVVKFGKIKFSQLGKTVSDSCS